MTLFYYLRAGLGSFMALTVVGLVVAEVLVPSLTVPPGRIHQLVGFSAALLLADLAASASSWRDYLDRVSLSFTLDSQDGDDEREGEP